MEPTLKISAIICTHNRDNYLGSALKSLVDQTLSKEEYEVIVVDNASKDSTQKVAQSFTDLLLNFSILKEEQLGLSHARNTGLRHAKAELVCFLDDDAIAKPNWLEKIINAFGTDDRIGVVGGKINAIWETARPDWLNDSLLPALTIIDWSESPFYIESRDKYVAGANIAFIKQAVLENGGFDPALGRIGKKLLSGEEIFLLDKIKEKGLKVYYDPAIEVDHLVPPNRLHQKWFRGRVYWEGVSEAKINLLKKQKTLPALAYTSFKVLIKGILNSQKGDIKHRFSKKLEISYHLGYLSALFRLV